MPFRVFLIAIMVLLTAGCRISPQAASDIGETIARNNDEVVKLLYLSGDDVARQAPKLSSRLIYNATNLSVKQSAALQEIQDRYYLHIKTAKLHLQGVCDTLTYAEYWQKYPSQDSMEVYYSHLAEENGIIILSIYFFIQNVFEYAGEQIDRQDAEDWQQRVKLAIDGICTFLG